MIQKLQRCQISEYLELISHLSKIEYNMENIYRVFDNMKDKIILVYTEEEKIVGTGSIQFEYKLSHGGYPVAHIEDLVVLPEYRKKSIGKLILNRLIEEAIFKNSYKIVLSCSDVNIQFYHRNGFRLVENTMRMDL